MRKFIYILSPENVGTRKTIKIVSSNTDIDKDFIFIFHFVIHYL